MPIPVTLLYGGLLALLVVGLGSWVSIKRLVLGTRMGMPIPYQLVRPIRAHGNAAEWVPLAIVALMMLELAHLPALWLHLAGGTYLALRLVHAVYALVKMPFVVGAALAVAHYAVLGAMVVAVLALHVYPLK
jgi:uncharacterized membrane protein YecN with MAPEG domain